MAQIVRLARADDPAVDDFRDLTASDKVAGRPIVIGEGVSVVERILGSRWRVRAVLGEAHRLAALGELLAPHDIPAFEVDRWLLSEIVGFRVTRGVLISAERVAPSPLESLLASGRTFAVLEGLNDFENLGALFRNAAAFGIDGIVLDERCADPLYRRSVRVSMGYVSTVPFAIVPSIPAALSAMHEAGIDTLALTPRPQAVALASLPVPPKWAVLLGAEGPGLSTDTMDAARYRVQIPMASGVDSLNVATAAAVAFSRLTGR